MNDPWLAALPGWRACAVAAQPEPLAACRTQAPQPEPYTFLEAEPAEGEPEATAQVALLMCTLAIRVVNHCTALHCFSAVTRAATGTPADGLILQPA